MSQNSVVQPYQNEYIEYLRDESRTEGYADSISFPTSEAEVVAVLQEVGASKQCITVQGGRTGLTAAAVPFGGHILNTSRMNHVLGLRQDEQGTFYVTLQPGVILAELNAYLHDKAFPKADVEAWNDTSKAVLQAFTAAPEQFFPPNPTETSAFIGGIVACNASGSRTFKYGPVRPYVTALRIALYDGSVLSLKRGEVFAKGRKLTLTKENGEIIEVALPTYTMPKAKNTSGYYVEEDMDAIDLFVGSDGTLGVITQVELKLVVKPAVVWSMNSFFDEAADAVAYVEKVREMDLGIAALEYFDENALAILRYQKENVSAFSAIPTINPEKKACVYTELHAANEDEMMEHLEAIMEALDEGGVGEDDTWLADAPAMMETLRFFRHAIPESVNMLIDERRRTDHGITKVGSDMSVPNGKLEEAMALYDSTLAERNLEYATWGHIGDNHLHVNILPRNIDEFHAGKKLFAEVWAPAIAAMGGAVSAEHGVGKIKAAFLQPMYGEEHIREMAALKAAFDPYGLFGRNNLFDWETYMKK